MSLYKFVLILKQRSPTQHPTPDRLFPQIKQRSHSPHPKPDRLFSQHQTAIAPQTQNPIAYSVIKQRAYKKYVTDIFPYSH
ncbi:hypothetical protein [Pseudanabaena sp. lw0831]|uniref:hypothetical protein n=1 Tax=Pseudanabaena sp. lw0831 TaxID=1357935 RepID=UPI001915DFD3|nr:hypothetical protein [Pseudanabaena sp. lw0831]